MTYKFFIIGFHAWVFPPLERSAGLEGLKNWTPKKLNIWQTLKMRWILNFWGYTIKSD